MHFSAKNGISNSSMAYTGGLADHLLQPRGLGVIFGSSAYSGAPLKKLVDHYLSDYSDQSDCR